MSDTPNHILHAHVGRQKVWYSLECLPGDGHFSADIEEWSGTAEELEANGFTVNHSRCWVVDWVENDGEDCIGGPDEWPGDGPWPVVCAFDNGLIIEPAWIAT